MPIVPDKEAPRWLYEILRHLDVRVSQNTVNLDAVGRGESPDGSGGPLLDTSGFFLLAGRPGGQIGRGATEPNGTLYLSSTASVSKGYIYLGWPNARVTLDETQKFLGINTTTPAVTLHIVNAVASTSTIVPSSDRTGGYNDSGSGGWAPDETHYYTGAGTPVAGAHYTALASNDGTTSWVAHNGGGASGTENGLNPERLGASDTIVPGVTYTVTISMFALGASPDDGGLVVGLVDSSGLVWFSANIDLNGLPTTPTTYTATVTCSGTPSGITDTPNGFSLAGSAALGTTGIYVCVSYVAIVALAGDITRWYDPTPTLLSYVDNAGSFHMPEITLVTGAGVGKWLRCSSSGGLGAWTSPAALTKSDDTNVTLTLTGSPTTALLNAAGLTLGWAGTLAVGRGGTGNANIYGTANTWTANQTMPVSSPFVSKSANYGVVITDQVIFVDCTGGAVTITLLTAVGNTGKRYTIKKIDSTANALTIDTTSSQTIDGSLTQVITTRYTAIEVISDGANWGII